MSRYIYQGQFSDQSGNAVASGTANVFLAGTATVASIYSNSTSTTVVNSVTSATNGKFSFYIDSADYNLSQKFKLSLSKVGYITTTSYDDITIFPEFEYTYYADASATDQSVDSNDNSLADLLAEIGTTNIRSIVCKQGTYTFSTTVDWSAYTNVTLKIQPGADFAVDTGVTVAIGCKIDVGLQKWITLTGTGFIKLDYSSVKEIYAEWFTTNTTPETTLMTTAVQGAINMASWIYGTVKLLPTTYLVSKLYFYYDAANNPSYNSGATKQAYINFIGSGASAITGSSTAADFRESKTIIKSTSVVDAVLDLQEVGGNHLMNFTLKDFSVEATAVTTAAILIDSIAKNSCLENVTVLMSSTGSYGVSISNMYLSKIENVEVVNQQSTPIGTGFYFYNSLRNGQIHKLGKLRTQMFNKGMYFRGNASIDGQTIVENFHAKDCNYGIHLHSIFGITLQGCMLGEGDYTVNALYVENSRGIIVQGNRFRANADVIKLGSTAGNILNLVIQGNVMERPSTTLLVAGSAGINFVSSATIARVTVLNNQLAGGANCYGTKLNTARTGTWIVNNATAATNETDNEYYADLFDGETNGITNFKFGNDIWFRAGNVPTTATGTGTFSRGDICWHNTPTTGGTAGWICISAGTPGTWKTFGAIST